MAEHVYKLFRARFTNAWYELSQAEQTNLLAQVGAALDKVGARSVLLCDARWSSEQWPFFGIEEYPDLEAVQAHTRLLTELNWPRYVESSTALGTAWREG